MDELAGLVSSQLNVIKTGFSMTKLEARLAMMSVFPLIMSLCLLFVVLVSTWFVVMCIAGLGLMQVLDSVILAMAGILIINLLVLGLLFRYVLFNVKNMRFEKTRAYLRDRDEFTQTGDDCNNEAGTAIMEPTEPS